MGLKSEQPGNFLGGKAGRYLFRIRALLLFWIHGSGTQDGAVIIRCAKEREDFASG